MDDSRGTLVLSRKTGERIMIGEEIEVQVVEIGVGRVRLLIRAPKSVSVHREEVAAKIEAGK